MVECGGVWCHLVVCEWRWQHRLQIMMVVVMVLICSGDGVAELKIKHDKMPAVVRVCPGTVMDTKWKPAITEDI